MDTGVGEWEMRGRGNEEKDGIGGTGREREREDALWEMVHIPLSLRVEL